MLQQPDSIAPCLTPGQVALAALHSRQHLGLQAVGLHLRQRRRQRRLPPCSLWRSVTVLALYFAQHRRPISRRLPSCTQSASQPLLASELQSLLAAPPCCPQLENVAHCKLTYNGMEQLENFVTVDPRASRTPTYSSTVQPSSSQDCVYLAHSFNNRVPVGGTSEEGSTCAGSVVSIMINAAAGCDATPPGSCCK